MTTTQRSTQYAPRSVNVRDTKAHLSALLDQVEQGETITITRNGLPVAHITPVHANGHPPDLTEIINSLCATSDDAPDLAPPSQARCLDPWPPLIPSSPGSRSSAAMVKDMRR